ncbi:unnamed protein product [Zymoseptoria tritici ST99CH_1A5]|uniref:Uncharacterized protein n=3 Tax=Zymoseptoria tritici TaxID=1047171 RepID=A0A1X7RYY6_ZYMT9|nr:unnamed protein product [Zymoseptoria tritici ST99CH_3D7]SMR55475.1 unnamed protein product [Zymoseptoria tritici ST99CH_1E4]SMR57849.1 unnamed protein product [Zymoseptoria tritici ST99CH_3D1]SMY26285.1 unnamed protein product [Zymoseptoria tritici ST99CH_1A5]
MQIHTEQQIEAADGAPELSAFLEKSLKYPYLHPDAWIAVDGIRHGPKSGPEGGWALHHLRRIEAGMRGESLAAESMEELVAKFGEDVVREATGGKAVTYDPDAVEGAKAGDDTRVDAIVGRSLSKKEKSMLEKPDRELTKAEKKKLRRAQEKLDRQREREAETAPSSSNKKRKREAIEDWADASSQVNGGAEGKESEEAIIARLEDQWQDKREYELEQEPIEGDHGDLGGAPVSYQNIPPPVVVEHDADGEVIVPPKKKAKVESEKDKEARRLAKKARRAEERKAKTNREAQPGVDIPIIKREDGREEIPKMKRESTASTEKKLGKKDKKKQKGIKKEEGTSAVAEPAPQGDSHGYLDTKPAVQTGPGLPDPVPSGQPQSEGHKKKNKIKIER